MDILPVFVVFEPAVGVEVVDEHGEGDEDEGGGQGGGVAGGREGVGDADAEGDATLPCQHRSEEHTSELQSL